MSKFDVNIPMIVFVTVPVEADDREAAEEQALDEVYLTNYCGNGGCDKLVGVSESNWSIEPGDVIEGNGFEILIQEG